MKKAPILIAALLAATPAFAHHSLTGYDSSRQVVVDGTVVEFRFAHPHPFLMVRAAVDGGKPETWQLEMDNLWELAEIGFTKTSFKPGERVVGRGSPSRTQATHIYLRRLDRPGDGLRYEQIGFSPQVNFKPKS